MKRTSVYFGIKVTKCSGVGGGYSRVPPNYYRSSAAASAPAAPATTTTVTLPSTRLHTTTRSTRLAGRPRREPRPARRRRWLTTKRLRSGGPDCRLWVEAREDLGWCVYAECPCSFWQFMPIIMYEFIRFFNLLVSCLASHEAVSTFTQLLLFLMRYLQHTLRNYLRSSLERMLILVFGIFFLTQNLLIVKWYHYSLVSCAYALVFVCVSCM